MDGDGEQREVRDGGRRFAGGCEFCRESREANGRVTNSEVLPRIVAGNYLRLPLLWAIINSRVVRISALNLN